MTQVVSSSPAETSPRPTPAEAPNAGTTLLPTTVVGSYSVPEWLERLKTDFYQRRISGAYLQEIHEVAIKAALKDQERAGVDIVSDGELRRDNDVDYFLARMPGVEIPHLAKAFYYDYYDVHVRHPIPEHDETPGLELVEDFLFTCEYTDRPIKFSFTGPFSLARRVHNEGGYANDDLVMAFARILNREAKALAAAGVAMLQIDEPFLAGYPIASSWRCGRSTPFTRVSRVRGERFTSATGTGMPARPGRATTTSCFRPFLRLGWTSSSWSSPARATTISICSGSTRARPSSSGWAL